MSNLLIIGTSLLLIVTVVLNVVANRTVAKQEKVITELCSLVERDMELFALIKPTIDQQQEVIKAQKLCIDSFVENKEESDEQR